MVFFGGLVRRHAGNTPTKIRSPLLAVEFRLVGEIRTVAVGTTIADRPPHRSVQARLRIRLLPWMSSGEARIRIGMQNAGLRNPPEQEWGETLPAHSRALTATDEDAPPQPTNATTENAQLSRVAR